MKRLMTGNEAVAWGALNAGARVISGYPGTPSTGALESLLQKDLPGRHVEWSTNEKVALEVACGAAWAGQRALCTMKMSGVNVAYDSLIAIAYSGVEGGLVLYVADDPGVSAGCCEQDTRGFAALADLPILEPSTVSEACTLAAFAFELSEQARTPVILRLVTALANTFATVEVEGPCAELAPATPRLIRDINRFTKAGAAICLAQHRDLIHRLEIAGEAIRSAGLNSLRLAPDPGGLGVIAAGIVHSYLDEAFELLEPYGLDPARISTLQVRASLPFPDREAEALLAHCESVLVLEELEPHLERHLIIAAQRLGYRGKIYGKLNGSLSRLGEYALPQVTRGLAEASGLALPEDFLKGDTSAEALAVPRPITVCAGCPHRGTYMAINRAIKKLKFKPDEVVVTGDIGCTILGMNPPFNTVWTEVSMGASVSLAQGYRYAGVQTPVIATIGDSTFFHGGMPGLVNAIQHNTDLTLVILDNLWTAMTGMQANPGTPCEAGEGSEGADRPVDIARIIPAMGVEHFFTVDPFDLDGATAALAQAMQLPGVKVVLSRRECAIQSGRRETLTRRVRVLPEKCNLCRLCIIETGCSALGVGDGTVTLDEALCRVCGLCVEACRREALIEERPAQATSGGLL